MINVEALRTATREAQARDASQKSRQRPNGPRMTFKLTAEVDAETLLDAFGERYAIVIFDSGITPADAHRIGLESLRKAYRDFKREAVSM